MFLQLVTLPVCPSVSAARRVFIGYLYSIHVWYPGIFAYPFISGIRNYQIVQVRICKTTCILGLKSEVSTRYLQSDPELFVWVLAIDMAAQWLYIVDVNEKSLIGWNGRFSFPVAVARSPADWRFCLSSFGSFLSLDTLTSTAFKFQMQMQ